MSASEGSTRITVTRSNEIRLSHFVVNGKRATLELLLLDTTTEAEKRTIEMLEKLRQAGVHKLTGYLQTQRQVIRFWDPFRPPRSLRNQIPPIEFKNRPERPVAIAAYLFAEAENEEEEDRCSTCNHPGHTGPAAECIVPKGEITKGACTNCHYSGKGKECSHRVAKEKKKANPESKAWPGFKTEYVGRVRQEFLERSLNILLEEKLVAEEREKQLRARGGKTKGEKEEENGGNSKTKVTSNDLEKELANVEGLEKMTVREGGAAFLDSDTDP
ncbi:hypothetical protein OQA88_9461 [Cercophora sp. LCS_1]